MLRNPRTTIGPILTLLLAGTALATTPAQKCESGKNKEAGKYGYCRQKAEAKFATTGDGRRERRRWRSAATSTPSQVAGSSEGRGRRRVPEHGRPDGDPGGTSTHDDERGDGARGRRAGGLPGRST